MGLSGVPPELIAATDWRPLRRESGEFPIIQQEEGQTMKELHPATEAILKFFAFEHLPEHLQAVSQPFHDLAWDMAGRFEGAELTTGLRKLLEAKDCMVRAAL